MAPATTAPPSLSLKGATSVQPPAKSSRTGAVARKIGPAVIAEHSIGSPWPARRGGRAAPRPVAEKRLVRRGRGRERQPAAPLQKRATTRRAGQPWEPTIRRAERVDRGNPGRGHQECR